MSDFKYKTRGNPIPQKQRLILDDGYEQRYLEQLEEEEPFNLDNMTGFTYPGSWLEGLAKRKRFLD